MFNKKVKQVINVDGMSCSHCAKKVENSLKEIDGVLKVSANLDKKEVQELLDKYEVNYIFIGSCEYQKYEGVNVALLSSLGEIVFIEENTMIVKL